MTSPFWLDATRSAPVSHVQNRHLLPHLGSADGRCPLQPNLIQALCGVCVALYQVVVSTLQRRWPIAGVLLGSTKVPVYRSGAGQGLHSDRPLSSL
ncbi:hypothetical protein J2S55_001470 [Streptosporangium brasiliense]|uniref:Uncharacterized protein n=1 Tax=Streptosporangium brasiliense TaxID=47480 RepID=A0ABT9QZ16_9ACTN|nr:hypothetical protein [Streptosporangium brasiliense]